MVELSSKFGCDPGEAVDLIEEAFRRGLVVEGLSFHVGSQCTNFENFVQALEHGGRRHAGGAGPRPRDQDPRHRRRLPGALRPAREAVQRRWRGDQRRDRPAVPAGHRDPRRARPLPGGHRRRRSVATVIGKAVRDGKLCYYIDDSVYHTFSGIIFDHCQYHLKAFKRGKTEISAVFGQTCDGLDTISHSEELPDLEIDDLVYSENIGAYSNASSTWFNGFPPAKVVHVNQ